jgi:putative FmdB family regulatory protein
VEPPTEEARVPLYDYQCEAGHRYEIRLPFGSPSEQPCETCGKPARRLLSAPPIVFKGSGWYVTDSQRSLRTGVGTERGGSEPDGDSGTSGDDASSNGSTEAPAAKKSTPRAKTTKAKAAADD